MRDIPEAYVKAAKKKIQAEPPEPKMKDGKPVEVFMYFFYFQGIAIWSLICSQVSLVIFRRMES